MEDVFTKGCRAHKDTIDAIRLRAHKVHADVNQHYDKVHPYSVHLDAVAEQTARFAPEVVVDERHTVPLMFGAYFHDSMEDARLTYNNVLRIAREYMGDEQAVMAAEIVYALTNEKGRTRAERADERYYSGIRTTPYASLCKCADRLANITYSVTHATDINSRMRDVYSAEMPHFLAAVTDRSASDIRLTVPAPMVQALLDLCEV